MKINLKQEKFQQFFRFIVVGGFATILHYMIYLALQIFIGLPYNFSYTIGYLISFVFNYIASTRYTFNTKAELSNGVKFGFAHLCNYLVHMILLNIFIFVGIPNNIAPIFVFPIAIIINFFMVRLALKEKQ